MSKVTPEIEVTKYSVKGGGNAEKVIATGTENEQALLQELEQTKRRMQTLQGESQLERKKVLLNRGKNLLTDDQMTELIKSDDPNDLSSWERILYGLEKERGTYQDPDTIPDPLRPPEGSVVALQGYGGYKVKNETEYESYRDMADDLYKKARDGDEDAERALEKLWLNAGKRIVAEDVNVNVSGCPRCSQPMLKADGDICSKCGYDTKPFVRGGGSVF